MADIVATITSGGTSYLNILKYGLGSVLLFGGGFYIYSFLKSGDLSKLKDLLHQQKQDEGMKQIQSIDEKQVTVQANIKNLESDSANKQIAIRQTLDASTKKIQDILDEQDHEKIDKMVKDGWKDL
jgi:hypothetical protein